MKYRKFGQLDWEVSVLGFGTTRLPLIEGKTAAINEAESIKMLRYAIDHGVNYLDLGYPYDMVRQEALLRVISQALQDGYRQRVKVTATLPSFLINSTSDLDLYLNKQLSWLGTDRIDFYILGGLNRETWSKLQGLGVISWAERAMSDGQIDKLGFSFHDDFQTLRGVLNAYDNWTLCQFQYSYVDIDHNPGVGGLKYAASKGLAVVVTEPLRGGRLVKKPPKPVARVWASDPKKRPLAEWGLLWVWNHPEVSTVVSDMSTMAQVVENITLARLAKANSLTVPEEVLISQVREAYCKLQPIPCAACRACMPCPQGIDVPRIFELYNDAIMFDDIEAARYIYRAEKHGINNFNECSTCVCCRGIDIVDWLNKAHKLLA